MNTRWNKFLDILRKNNISFSTSIVGENIEVIYVKGLYMESCQWNRLHSLDQIDFLAKLGIDYERPRLHKWNAHQEFKKRRYL